jgi:hypothetical protein
MSLEQQFTSSYNHDIIYHIIQFIKNVNKDPWTIVKTTSEEYYGEVVILCGQQEYKCYEGIPIRLVHGWEYEIHQVQFTVGDRLEFLTLYEDYNRVTKKYICLLKLLHRRYQMWYIMSENYSDSNVDIVVQDGTNQRKFSTSSLKCKL